MERADRDIPKDIKMPHICNREGDIYGLSGKAEYIAGAFLIRTAKNRMTAENTQIPDKIRKTHCKYRVKVGIPGDSRHNRKERETVSRIRHAGYEIKKPQIKNKELLPSLKVNAVYAREETPPGGHRGDREVSHDQ